jgi:hypothetical protein
MHNVNFVFFAVALHNILLYNYISYIRTKDFELFDFQSFDFNRYLVKVVPETLRSY